MQISEAEVEEFLIDVLKTKLVRAKIDQGNQVRFLFLEFEIGPKIASFKP